MDVHTSVASTSAPAQAALAAPVTSTAPPVRAAMARASASTAGSGRYCAGAAIRTRIPAVAPPSR